MTMINIIPKELEKYVWFESANTLTHSDDMPETLLELFEQTKSAILKASLEKKNSFKETKLTEKWYKKNKNDIIWWLENQDVVGEHIFSFDKKIKFNLFADYPNKLTSEQKEIFDKENPFWKNFFESKN